jgi:hypothetical protein
MARGIPTPEGVTALRVSPGRIHAARWSLYRGTDTNPLTGDWIGDLVHWIAEGEWEFQPAHTIVTLTGETPQAVLEGVS